MSETKRELLKFGDGPNAIMMLPAKPGNCEICNHKHEPELPHNAESVFYQMRFYYENGGRWPTWADAMSHCTRDVKDFWTAELERMKVDVNAKFAQPRQANVSFEIVPGASLQTTVTIPAGLEITEGQLQKLADEHKGDQPSFVETLIKISEADKNK